MSKIAIVLILAKRLNKQIRFTSQGIGPLGEFADWYKNLFYGIKTNLYVRDSPSLSVGREQLCLNTQLCPDDLLIQNEQWYSFPSKFKLPQDPYIAIEPFIPIDDLQTHKEQISAFAEKIYNIFGYRIIYMPFDLVHFGTNQAYICASFCQNSIVYDITNYRYPKFEDILRIIKGAQFVITARYHGLVLALSQRIPVIHIVNNAYGDYGKIKARSILQQCFSTCNVEELFCSQSLYDTFDKVANQYKDLCVKQKLLYNNNLYEKNIKRVRKERLNMITSILH